MQILSQKGDTDEAIACFREAVRLEPENKSIIQVSIAQHSTLQTKSLG